MYLPTFQRAPLPTEIIAGGDSVNRKRNSIGRNCACRSKNCKNHNVVFPPDKSQRIIDATPEPWNICFAFMAYLDMRTYGCCRGTRMLFHRTSERQ